MVFTPLQNEILRSLAEMQQTISSWNNRVLDTHDAHRWPHRSVVSGSPYALVDHTSPSLEGSNRWQHRCVVLLEHRNKPNPPTHPPTPLYPPLITTESSYSTSPNPNHSPNPLVFIPQSTPSVQKLHLQSIRLKRNLQRWSPMQMKRQRSPTRREHHQMEMARCMSCPSPSVVSNPLAVAVPATAIATADVLQGNSSDEPILDKGEQLIPPGDAEFNLYLDAPLSVADMIVQKDFDFPIGLISIDCEKLIGVIVSVDADFVEAPQSEITRAVMSNDYGELITVKMNFQGPALFDNFLFLRIEEPLLDNGQTFVVFGDAALANYNRDDTLVTVTSNSDVLIADSQNLIFEPGDLGSMKHHYGEFTAFKMQFEVLASLFHNSLYLRTVCSYNFSSPATCVNYHCLRGVYDLENNFVVVTVDPLWRDEFEWLCFIYAGWFGNIPIHADTYIYILFVLGRDFSLMYLQV